ncbi:hypothetical protein AB0N05_05910 [Nocardia sp. NPDC051030]|uniref:hypothetical protein n=1 Tax=Nocardia sp. NPDC051030 TaxID=3155162 RepID=UPI00343DC61B
MPEELDPLKRARLERERQDRAEKSRVRKIHERADNYHTGRAHERGETPERGYQREVTVSTEFGPRKLDSANLTERKATEYKSGRQLKDPKTLIQLEKERELIQAGWQITWSIPADTKIDPSIQKSLNALARDHADSFTVERPTREEVNRAIALGKQLERSAGKQLELIDSQQLHREQNARDRVARLQEIARTREAADKAVQQQRELDAARAREAAQLAYERGLHRELPGHVAQLIARGMPAPGIEIAGAPDADSGHTRAGNEARARTREARTKEPVARTIS